MMYISTLKILTSVTTTIGIQWFSIFAWMHFILMIPLDVKTFPFRAFLVGMTQSKRSIPRKTASILDPKDNRHPLSNEPYFG